MANLFATATALCSPDAIHRTVQDDRLDTPVTPRLPGTVSVQPADTEHNLNLALDIARAPCNNT